ncbi:hypothetical protein EON64_15535 [archaeon]|nr:MAG: hypothetical protein EON64_15535 [archaeon]
MSLNVVLGAKRLTVVEVVTLSRPVSDCLKIDDSALAKLDEQWSVVDESKLSKAVLPDLESLRISADKSTNLPISVVRAGLVVRIHTLLISKTLVRKHVILALADLLNKQNTPAVSSMESAGTALAACLESQGLSLYASELQALSGHSYMAIALTALVVGAGHTLVRSLDALSSLSVEAGGGGLEAFDLGWYETHRPHRGMIQSAGTLRSLFEGSKRVLSGATVVHQSLQTLPQSTGPALDVLTAAYK